MITLPYPCNIQLNTSFDEDVMINSVDASTNLSAIKVLYPNPIKRKATLVYGGLSMEESLVLEQAIQGTRGVERILYEGKKYRAISYNTEYNNNVSLTLNLEQVG